MWSAATLLLAAAAGAQVPPASDGPQGASNRPHAAGEDAVGRAGMLAGVDGMAGASATLPVGTFAEVTALDSGHVAIVRIASVAAAGPDRLIELSAAAARALGVVAGAAVRVRPVNPDASDRAAILTGGHAAPRLDAPAVLLAGLRQGLPPASGAPVPRPSPMAAAPLPVSRPVARPPAAAAPIRTPNPAPAPAIADPRYVQVAAFGSRASATALARKLGGSVSAAGALWRVRLGPYAGEAAARAARDGVAKRGYGDATIVR